MSLSKKTWQSGCWTLATVLGHSRDRPPPDTAVSPLNYCTVCQLRSHFQFVPLHGASGVVPAEPVTVALVCSPSTACPAFPGTHRSSCPFLCRSPPKRQHFLLEEHIRSSASLLGTLPCWVKRNPSPVCPSQPSCATLLIHPCRSHRACAPAVPSAWSTPHSRSCCSQWPPSQFAVAPGLGGHRCGVPFLVATRASCGHVVRVRLFP